MSWTAEAEERLRAAGYRAGNARSRVIAYLSVQPCCRGAQEIYEELAARDAKVGLASVYRILDTLDELGLLQRVEVGDGIVRYEPVRTDADHHHHLVCDGCGKVERFADLSLERAIAGLGERSGFAVAEHEVVLRGACADCRAA